MTRQKRILEWAVRTFGPVFGKANIQSKEERALRFLEEALETAHASELGYVQALAMLNRVYSRPQGDLAQEIGSALLCLEALAEAAGVDAQAELEREFARVQAISPEEFAIRHAAKKSAGLAV
ncbi:MAG: hypothetical protein AMXMBFR33_01730 [Candidatus Xenobia bacterium]